MKIIIRYNKNPIYPSTWVLKCHSFYMHLNMTIPIHFGEGNSTPLQYSCLENPIDGGAWWAAVHGVAKSRTRLSDFPFTFHFHALEKEMATHSSVLAWRIPGTREPGGLLSLGSQRVGHDWSGLSSSSSIPIHLTVCRYIYIYLKTFTDINIQKCVYRYVHTQLQHLCTNVSIFFLNISG